MRLPLLCEKTGALAIVELGLMTGWQAGRQMECCKVSNFKFCILTFKMHVIGILNRFLALIKLYQ